jgi:hypothetical protein
MNIIIRIYYIKYNYSTDTWNTVDIISRSVTKDTIYPSINIDKDDNVNIVYMDTKAYISFLSFNEVSIYSSNSTGVTTAYNNGKKIAKSSNDNLYACFNNTINSNTQIQVYKSINNGKIWADTKFPQISEYNQT